MTILRRALLALLVLALVLPEMGCLTLVSSRDAARRSSPYHSGRVMKPVVAVTDFENLSSFPGQWNLGRGMADLLVAQLLETERVVVLERKHLDEVVGEILRQGQDLFRREGRVEKGRLKNAKYLVRGTVTDFTETAETSGWFGIRWLRLFGRGARSRVAITVHVSDVETGEIVSSVKAAKSVSAGGVGASARYKDLAFGGDAFFRTPLGKATEAAIKSAVAQIFRDLPVAYWQGRVAEAGPDDVVINGGKNVRIREGDVFRVREEGRDITDPATGNVIERVPGKVVGKIRITEVNAASAHAVLVDGAAQRGEYLEPGE
ncbi:MAG: CsgG/HfaB family protein [Verrucomicrobiota bacterium]